MQQKLNSDIELMKVQQEIEELREQNAALRVDCDKSRKVQQAVASF